MFVFVYEIVNCVDANLDIFFLFFNYHYIINFVSLISRQFVVKEIHFSVSRKHRVFVTNNKLFSQANFHIMENYLPELPV